MLLGLFVCILCIPFGLCEKKSVYWWRQCDESLQQNIKNTESNRKNPIFCDLILYFGTQFHMSLHSKLFFIYIYIYKENSPIKIFEIFLWRKKTEPKKLGSSKWTMHGVFKRQWSVEEFLNQNLQKIIFLKWVSWCFICKQYILENSVKILWTLEFHIVHCAHLLSLSFTLSLSLSPFYLA